jgi:hypothetical protein
MAMVLDFDRKFQRQMRQQMGVSSKMHKKNKDTEGMKSIKSAMRAKLMRLTVNEMNENSKATAKAKQEAQLKQAQDFAMSLKTKFLDKGADASAEVDTSEPKVTTEESATAEEKKAPVVPILKTQDLTSDLTNRKTGERNVTFDKGQKEGAAETEAKSEE